jgi:hypothetical protein
MTSSPVWFRRVQGVPKMLKQKTHFEQVPLEVVAKIVKETGGEITIEPARAIADQELEAREPGAAKLGGRRKNLSLVRGKQVRYQAP